MTPRSCWWKRPLDLAVLLVACLPALLVGLLIALMVVVKLGRPILFWQERPGLAGRPFRLVKFRSMVTTGPTGPLDDAARLTPFGRWLRATSLDELPELWNVLKGEMTLVGPRPLLMEYVPLYDAAQARRMAVKPGLTGWAQVMGRNALSWPDRFRLDVWYVDNVSFLLDIKILILTIGAVVARRGISQEGHSTMERFRGNA